MNKQKPNRFSHTLENCLFAKQELIKEGLKDDDFYLHDASWSDTYLDKEPMIKTNNDDCVSALELYKQKYFSEEHDKDMVDFYIENGFI
jgi:hypothetical protein